MQQFVNFAPKITPAGMGALTVEQIAAEPSLHSASPMFVYQHGGALAKRMLAQVSTLYAKEIAKAEKAGLSAIVDVRTQRLMPGMFPSIPGWHCDAVPRNSYHGQPEFGAIIPEAFHVACLLSTGLYGISNTEFVSDPVKIRVYDDEKVYKDVHREVERIDPAKRVLQDGEFAFFTPKTIHRAVACHVRGWRIFFRFSMYHKPPLANAIPNAQQVYILSEANGW